MKTKLYALLLEDVKKDAELLQEILTDEGYDLEIDVVQTEQNFVACLKKNNYDIIFADYTLPTFNGQFALELAKIIAPNVPFISISGTIGEDRAVELLKQGATDYILKDRMERLGFATKRALDAASHLNKFRQQEIEIQTNRRLLQTVINNALDSIYIKDNTGKYLLVNEAAERTMGIKASEIIGKSDVSLVNAEIAAGIMESDRMVLENGKPYSSEYSNIGADGVMRTFHTIKCPMFDESGKPAGLFGITREITERKNLENSLTQAKEKAEESDKLKTAFLHSISHEIRTPMNAIIGFSDFLRSPDLEPEKRTEFIDIISRSCFQLLDIIEKIMITASISSGQVNIVPEEIDLSSLFSILHSEFKSKAKAKEILLTYDQKDCTIVSDSKKLKAILSYLIDNAIKFTNSGDVNFGFTVRDSSVPAMVEFYVKDSGVGIPQSKIEHIFERFRQADLSILYDFGGMGLGLSISKGYVELLGGEIWVKSQQGAGSTFYFTIPYKQ